MLTQGSELDRLFYNCDLEAIGRQAFATHVWFQANPDPAWIKIWLLDMQLVGTDSVAVLMAGNNPHISQQLHYIIGFMNVATNAPPIQFKSVTVLKYNVQCVTESANDSNASQCLPGCDFKLLFPPSSGYQTAFVYNDSNVLCVPIRTSTEPVEIDQLDFSHGGNNVLGAGYSCDGQGLLFSVASGMITIQPSHQPSRDKSK